MYQKKYLRSSLPGKASALTLGWAPFRFYPVQKHLSRNYRPHKVTSVKDNTVQIAVDGYENTLSIHHATLSPVSRGYCDDDPADEKEQTYQKYLRSDEDTDEYRRVNDSINIIYKIVYHVCSELASNI